MPLKIKLKFVEEVLNLDGSPLKEIGHDENGVAAYTGRNVMLNHVLANALVNPPESADLYKVTDWGKSIYKGELLELDKPDCDKLKKYAEDSKTVSRLVKRQIVDIIDAAVDLAKQEDKKPKAEIEKAEIEKAD